MRRTVAQELCEAGAVSVNGLLARSARPLHVGDQITLRRLERTLTVRVIALPAAKQTSRRDASNLYEIIDDTETMRATT